MCKLGDIIVISEFKNEFNQIVKRHSFVVIDEKENTIEGMNYDFVSNMLCSFHNENHRKRKLSFKENLEISKKSIINNNLNEKNGFIKADQLYYFNKANIDYHIIGKLNDRAMKKLFQLLIMLDNEDRIKYITTNLK